MYLNRFIVGSNNNTFFIVTHDNNYPNGTIRIGISCISIHPKMKHIKSKNKQVRERQRQ